MNPVPSFRRGPLYPIVVSRIETYTPDSEPKVTFRAAKGSRSALGKTYDDAVSTLLTMEEHGLTAKYAAIAAHRRLNQP